MTKFVHDARMKIYPMILRDFIVYILFGILFIPYMGLAFFIIHKILFVITFGFFSLMGDNPEVTALDIRAENFLEYWYPIILMTGLIFGMLGALRAFRTYQCCRYYCHLNGIKLTELSSLTYKGFMEKLESLSSMPDGNKVFEKAGECYFSDQLDADNVNAQKITYKIFHGARIGKYDSAYIRSTFHDGMQ